MTEQARAFDFGPFRLDPANHELLRDGVPVPLKPKAFDTLLLLVENRGRVLGKDELLRSLWPHSIVEEASLTQNIYEARRALADTDREHRYIENVPKRGYRFVADVSVATTRATIAVLPFRALPRSAGSEYLELGIADALITVLSNLRRLVVRPANAVSRYSGALVDPVVCGRELSVELVVDGSFQTTTEGRVRVSVRLLDVTSGAALWAGTFDEKGTDIFALQDSIAQKVVAAIGPELRDPERAVLTRHYTESTEAYHLYLKGRYNWNKVTADGLWKAIEFFKAAIAADPLYALAWVGVSDAYTSLDWYGVLSTRESNPHAIAAARRALEIDDRLAEAHASMGMALQYSWDWAGAEREYRAAIALNPGYAPARQWYGVFLAFMGRFDEALSQVRRAEKLDPVSLSIGSQVGLVLMLARRYAEAAGQLQKVMELDADSVEARFLLAVTHELQGETARAIAIYRGLPAENPDFQAMLAHAYAASGQVAEARAIVGELVALGRDRYIPPFWLAVAYAGLGDAEQALQALARACDDPDDSMLALRVFPMLDPLRGDRRFEKILRRMGLPL